MAYVPKEWGIYTWDEGKTTQENISAAILANALIGVEDMQRIENALETLDGDLGIAKGDILTKASTTELGEVQGDVNILTGDVNILQGQMENKANLTDLADKADRSELADKADRSELADKANLSDLATKADLSDLEDKADQSVVEGIGEDVGELQSQMGTKADVVYITAGGPVPPGTPDLALVIELPGE